MRSYWPLAAFFTVTAAISGGLFWAAGAKERAGWRLCDDAIKATLKAPATYRRVEGPETFAIGDSMFRITYDAENSFGVPLRSKGSCALNADRTGADWVQYPEPL